MPKKRFSDEQIAFALRQAEAGTTVGEICRKMKIGQAKRLKDLEKENARLKRLLADAELDKSVLKEAAAGNW